MTFSSNHKNQIEVATLDLTSHVVSNYNNILNCFKTKNICFNEIVNMLCMMERLTKHKKAATVFFLAHLLVLQ